MTWPGQQVNPTYPQLSYHDSQWNCTNTIQVNSSKERHSLAINSKEWGKKAQLGKKPVALGLCFFFPISLNLISFNLKRLAAVSQVPSLQRLFAHAQPSDPLWAAAAPQHVSACWC